MEMPAYKRARPCIFILTLVTEANIGTSDVVKSDGKHTKRKSGSRSTKTQNPRPNSTSNPSTPQTGLNAPKGSFSFDSTKMQINEIATICISPKKDYGYVQGKTVDLKSANVLECNERLPEEHSLLGDLKNSDLLADASGCPTPTKVPDSRAVLDVNLLKHCLTKAIICIFI
jgi:hypothetical protein